MITHHEPVARYRVAERIRRAETRALRREAWSGRHSTSATGPRHVIATVLRRLADRLEPRPRRTGLSVVR